MKSCLNCIYSSLLLVTGIFFMQCSGNNADSILKKAADEINKSCPIKIDEVTTLDSCQILPNRTFRYNYTMVFDEGFASQEKSTLEQRSKKPNYVQQNPTLLKELIKIQTTFQHAYYNADGKEFAVVTFTPEQYNRKPDMQSDEYVYNEIKDIAKAFSANLPLEYTKGMEITRINTSYPRTVIYDVQNETIEKSDLFDSIQFKEQRILPLTQALRKNVFTTLLKDVNILYRCRYFDKNKEYLCTIEIFFEDFE